MADGSFWRRDQQGNGRFYHHKTKTRGVRREDNSFTIENLEGSFTQRPDGTMKLKDKQGMTLIQRPDGSQYVKKPDGTIIEEN